MACSLVPSITTRPWNTVGGYVFYISRGSSFQLNTFIIVIKQKYIEANDLVSSPLGLALLIEI